MKSTLLFFSFLFLFTAHAQVKDNFSCAYEEQLQKNLGDDPFLKDSLKSYNLQYADFVRLKSTLTISGTIYTLPTVVHIIHNGAVLGTEANPTNSSVAETLQYANDRFRHASGLNFTNPNSGIDTEIEFCLSTVDPTGAYTTGVIRYYEPDLAVGPYTDLYDFILNTQWDVTKYYNLYIITDMTNAAGVYLSGIDVTVYNSGSFWSGLIAHETGHYLSLEHIFNGACPNGNCLTTGDFVCDTPPKASSGTNGGTCDAPNNSCLTDEDDLNVRNPYRPTSNGGSGDSQDMLENYMDYTGSCWDAFSIGQTTRMRFNISNNRLPLVNNASIACATATPSAYEIGINSFAISNSPCSSSASIATASITNHGTSSVNNFKVKVFQNSTLLSTQTVIRTIPSGGTKTVDINSTFNLVDGTNLIEVRTELPNSQTDGFENNDWTMQAFEFSASGAVPPISESLNAGWPTGYTITNDTKLDWTIRTSDASRTPCLGDSYAYALAYANPAETATMRLPIINLAGLTGAKLTFDYGYVQRYDHVDNILSVTVITDCTISQEVWTKSGSTLSTGGYSNQVTIYPDCSHLVTETVDLTPFVGATDLQIEFTVNGLYYSPLILDNINIEPSTASCEAIDLSFSDLHSGIQNRIASNTITSTSTIASGADISFKAGQSITLNPGFSVTSGASFHAYIGTCTMSPFQPSLPEIEQEKLVETPVSSQLKIAPNPIKQAAQIDFFLPTNHSVALYLYDITGNKITSQQRNNLGKGWHTTTIDVSQIPAGVYHIVLQTVGEVLTEKVLVVK